MARTGSVLAAQTGSCEPVALSPDRWPVTRAALVEAGRATLARLRRLVRGPGRVRMPSGLFFAPQDLRATDPAIATEMASGLFVFANGRVALPSGTSPFGREAPSRAWAEELYGFGWLRHLRAAETDEARAVGRWLVAQALASHRRDLDRDLARSPPIAARRVMAMLAHSPLLLTGATHDFYGRYLRRLGRDAAWLGRAMWYAPIPADRLAAAIGLSFAALCCGGLEAQVRAATRALSAELDAQILPDGGPLDRNPATLVELLLDLLPLRLLYASRALEPPDAVDRAIDRMMAMLRLLRLGDGDLAHFNGMGRTPIGELATILAQEREDAIPAPPQGQVSGYGRLEAGRTILVADIGRAPPLASSAEAHAGWLSFEMSSGRHRIVVNAGAPPAGAPARGPSRLTDSHSTLVLGGEPSGHPIAPGEGWAAAFLVGRLGRVLPDGPAGTGSKQDLADETGTALTGRHDAYGPAFGAVHTRRFRLAADGGELEGEDEIALSGAGAEPGAGQVRFHLHPSVRAQEEPGGGGILIELPDGERWRFGAEGATPRLADSVVFAVPEGRRATRQIVLDMPLPAGTRHASLRWLFLRA